MTTDTTTLAPRPPQAQYTCPHCGGMLDLGAIAPAPMIGTMSTSPTVAPAPSLTVRQAGAWLDGFFPITSSLRGSQPSANTPSHDRRVRPRWIRWALMAAPLFLIVLWLLERAAFGTPIPAILLSPPTPTLAPTRTVPAPEQAVLLAVIAQYNAADEQVAATLSLDPIRPFLDDTGPLLARRSQELAHRKQSGSTHATRLLRWAVGTITIDAAGTTATLVTQETWENREIGAVATQTATVRVAYTLRRAHAQAPWRIYDANHIIL